jgi:hypothetical protein
LPVPGIVDEDVDAAELVADDARRLDRGAPSPNWRYNAIIDSITCWVPPCLVATSRHRSLSPLLCSGAWSP